MTARGNERRAIFRDDVDRERFIGILARVAEESGWTVLAYCLMGNHFHLLVRTPEPNLNGGMHRLNGTYAQWFNRRHARVGHLFQGRYGARLVRGDSHLHATIRYIVRNPVRSGLCSNPRDWRWSSHLAVLGHASAPSFLAVETLLAYYGADRQRALLGYLEEVERNHAPHLDRFFRAPQPSLAVVFARAPRDSAIAAAHADGYSLREIARHLGVNVSTVSRRLQRHRLAPSGATPVPDPGVARMFAENFATKHGDAPAEVAAVAPKL